ncbi:Integrin beta-PS [Nymphon striatum]|nr:Integrin beta-PS [Nymphon striatum]
MDISWKSDMPGNLKHGFFRATIESTLMYMELQHGPTLRNDPCTLATTCSECIRKGPQCAWCSKPDFLAQSASRCNAITALKLKNCPTEYLTYPRDERENKLNKNLSMPGVTIEDIVQIKPQHVSLKLRPKSSYPLLVRFRQAEDYPVDLYYLMDLSNSMKDDKEKLAELGNLLAEQMNKITSNFRLGFGSFVDKVVMPYTNTVPAKLIEPCAGCAAPYGFKNHMSLSVNTSKFAEEVINAPVSGNLDGPEGGFDAIMQAIVCKDEIGWRQNSRKLLLFSTDSSFHSAGDGKIGGIVKPNDGRCHLEDGLYSESSNQDYPSLSQINQQAHDKKVNIIFAVTAKQVPIYEKVGNKIEGASSGKLSNDSSNVVELVKNQYNKITSSVEMKDDAPDFVEVTYYSKCLGNNRVPTNICKGLTIGKEVEFDIEIKVLRCPENRDQWKTNFTIYPVTFAPLVIDLEVSCECDCEKPEMEERNSEMCSGGNGTYQCGICQCYGDRTGRFCECDRSSSKALNDSNCYYKDQKFACSKRGKCICGRCECDSSESISGEFCHCDSSKCERRNGLLCSGPEFGICECGECVCLKGRRGDSCDCDPITKCINTENGDSEVCSGHGTCPCNRCECDEINGEKYYGKYCQNHPNMRKECSDVEHCVQCFVHQSGPYFENYEYCKNCTDDLIIVKKEVIEDVEQFCGGFLFAVDVDKMKVVSKELYYYYSEDYIKQCFGKIDDDCKFRFILITNDTVPFILAQEKKECRESDSLIAVVVGLIIGIVLIGLLLLLIWKLLTTIHDRREFAKFEKEANSVKWDTSVNPLFKGATSTFKNPTYGGK